MAKVEDDLIADAVIETNKEIAAAAWGEDEDLDEAGDRSLEEASDGLDEETVESEEGEAEEAADEETEGDEQSDEGEAAKADADKKSADAQGDKAKTEDARIPPGRLREANERARAAEAANAALKAERDADRQRFEKTTAELTAKFDGVLAALQRQQPQNGQQPVADKPVAPDMFEDPKGFAEHLTKGFKEELAQRDQAMRNMRFEISMEIAHANAKEAFEEAWSAINQLPKSPDSQVIVQRIVNAQNPGAALIDWHNQTKTLKEVGSDPAKYKERIAQETREALMKDPEFRKQLLAELRAEASTGDHGRPRSITRLPKSLNGAPGGSATGQAFEFDNDDSEQAIADAAWR